MLEVTSEALPERWLGLWEAMGGGVGAESSGPGLQEWLEDVYFDGERREDLTGEDIAKLGQIIRKLLRFEPSARASASEILNDPWFRDWTIRHVHIIYLHRGGIPARGHKSVKGHEVARVLRNIDMIRPVDPPCCEDSYKKHQVILQKEFLLVSFVAAQRLLDHGVTANY